MILLDTNILIDLSTTGNPRFKHILEWLDDGVHLCTSAVAWSEFLNGPVTKVQKNAVYSIIDRNVIEFNEQQAEHASKLFHYIGRKRGSHADCMIAAAALHRNIPIATRNIKDFDRFTPYGLKVEAIPTT